MDEAQAVGDNHMSWFAIHRMIEEVEIWTSLLINITIIASAIPTAIAIFRKLPIQRLAKYASAGAVVGFTLTAALAVAWITIAPSLKHDELCKRLLDLKNDDDAAGIIVLSHGRC
jgi:hypothetical protein